MRRLTLGSLLNWKAGEFPNSLTALRYYRPVIVMSGGHPRILLHWTLPLMRSSLVRRASLERGELSGIQITMANNAEDILEDTSITVVLNSKQRRFRLK